MGYIYGLPWYTSSLSQFIVRNVVIKNIPCRFRAVSAMYVVFMFVTDRNWWIFWRDASECLLFSEVEGLIRSMLEGSHVPAHL